MVGRLVTVALDRLRLDAKRLSAKGRYAEALSCLERIVQAQPSRDDQLTIATLCDALGRQDRAQEALSSLSRPIPTMRTYSANSAARTFCAAALSKPSGACSKASGYRRRDHSES